MPLSPASPPRLVVMGVSGCGKSSVGEGIAARACIAFVEGDQLHPPANVAKMAAGTPLEDADRWPWLDIIAGRLRDAAAAGEGLIVSCSALKRIYRDHLRAAAPGLNFLFLKGSRDVLAARMARRTDHFMPASLLDSQLATLEDPTGEDGVTTISVDGSKDEMAADAWAAFATMTRRDP